MKLLSLKPRASATISTFSGVDLSTVLAAQGKEPRAPTGHIDTYYLIKAAVRSCIRSVNVETFALLVACTTQPDE